MNDQRKANPRKVHFHVSDDFIGVIQKMKKIQDDFSKAILSHQQNLSGLGDIIKYTFEKIEDNVELYSETGWPIPELLTPKELLDLYENADISTIDDKMVTVYDEGTPDFGFFKEEIFNSKELEEWHHLLTECFWCYSHQKYQVVIPALLSILEGILAKKLNRIDKSINIHNWLKSKLSKKDPSFDILYLKSINKFLAHLFKSIDFKNRTHPKLNRHLVLHGRSSRKWNKSDALKLMLNIYVIDSLK